MNKKYLTALLLLISFVLASCTQEIIENETPQTLITPQGEFPASAFEEGFVRIYVDEDFNVADMDSLPGMKVTRTFPYSGKFEKRTHEAGLDRWYDVRFDASTSTLTKAGVTFKNVKGVLEVEYQPKIDNSEFSRIVAADNSQLPEVRTNDYSYPFDDPYLSGQWHYINTGSIESHSKGCDINVENVWRYISTGSDNVIVAVLDEGVEATHPDLAANIWEDPERSGSHGYNFCTDSYTINPGNHGTHVAGTISAVNNNGIGVSGIAGGDSKAGVKGVRIMSCQIISGTTSGNSPAAMKWAADHGAVISQNSWSYVGINYVPQSMADAIDYFNDYAGIDENGNQTGPMAGGIVIFAAGNEATDYTSPAVYEGVIAVTATDAKFTMAPYSNYGDWVDLSAPGGIDETGSKVLSTITDGQYGYTYGTSMACPHVSGIAALLVSKFGGPGFTRSMLWNKLLANVRDISSYNPGIKMGHGFADAYAAITSTSSGTPPEPVTDLTVNGVSSNTITFTLSVTADKDEGKAAGVIIHCNSAKGNKTTQAKADGLSVGDKMTVKVSGLEFTTDYVCYCEAYDNSGSHSESSNFVKATTGENHAPVIKTDDNLNFTIKNHESKKLTFHLSDPDGHSFSYVLETDNEAEYGSPEYTGSTVTVIIPGPSSKPGTYQSNFAVYDEYMMCTRMQYNYTILENHAPALIGQPDNYVFNDTTEVVEYDLRDFFTDEDGESLTYKIVSTGDKCITVNGSSSNIQISTLKFGSTTLVVTATDGLGKSASYTQQILVRDGSYKFDVYPTTVTDGTLQVRTTESGTVRIVIAASTGAVIYDETTTCGPFEPKAIDISKFAGGVYSVTVDNGTETTTRNIVKL